MSNASTTSANTKQPTEEVMAVIVGAISAMGYTADQIACVRPIISQNWRLEGRLKGRGC